eukprot:CFRG2333T1
MRGYLLACTERVVPTKQKRDHVVMVDNFPSDDISDLNPHARPFRAVSGGSGGSESNDSEFIENRQGNVIVRSAGETGIVVESSRRIPCETTDNPIGKVATINSSVRGKESVSRNLTAIPFLMSTSAKNNPHVNRRHTISSQDESVNVGRSSIIAKSQYQPRSDGSRRPCSFSSQNCARKGNQNSPQKSYYTNSNTSRSPSWGDCKARGSRTSTRALHSTNSSALCVDDDSGRTAEKGQHRKRRYSVDTLDFTELTHVNVASFLKHIRLHKYTDTLLENKVDFSALISMDENELEVVGIHARGARLRLIKAIERYNEFLSDKWSSSGEGSELGRIDDLPSSSPTSPNNLSPIAAQSVGGNDLSVSASAFVDLSFRHPVFVQQPKQYIYETQQQNHQQAIHIKPESRPHLSAVEPGHRVYPSVVGMQDVDIYSSSPAHNSRLYSHSGNDVAVHTLPNHEYSVMGAFSSHTWDGDHMAMVAADTPNTATASRPIAIGTPASHTVVENLIHENQNVGRPRATSAPPPRSSLFSWPMPISSSNNVREHEMNVPSQMPHRQEQLLHLQHSQQIPSGNIADVLYDSTDSQFGGHHQSHCTNGVDVRRNVDEKVSDSNLELNQMVVEQGMRLLSLIESTEDVSKMTDANTFFSVFNSPTPLSASKSREAGQDSYFVRNPTNRGCVGIPPVNGRLSDDLRWVGTSDAWTGTNAFS